MKSIPNINFTLKHDICIGCGICQGTCPSGALTFQVSNGMFCPEIDDAKCNNSKGCHRCYDSCPGVGVNLVTLSQEYFDDNETKADKYAGRYLKCFAACSNDESIRFQCASGGVLTQFLVWLLETNRIDGAVVTKFDADAPFKVKTFIASTREEIISAKGSKYAPVTYNNIVQDIKSAQGSRYVIVGLPCHIHGFRKLEKIDKRFGEKIFGYFSLFCSGSQTFHYTEYILSKCHLDINKINYLSYREGEPSGMVVKGNGIEFFKKYSDYNRPLKSTFYPRRCLLCVDFQGELADIAFGDIMAKPEDAFGNGMNAVIVRSSKWLSLFEQATNEGAICSNEISLERLNYKRAMATVKKEQNGSFVFLLHKLGKTVPMYDTKYVGHVKLNTVLKYCVKRIKQYVGRHRWLWFLLPSIR